jgi:PEP-CTERM motif
MVLVALVGLSPAVSHADQEGEHFASALRRHHDHHTYHVPEPSTDALLLVGIGVISLIGYGVQRRRQAA